MVRAGLPVNLRDHKGNSLLMLASYHGHEEMVGALLDAAPSLIAETSVARLRSAAWLSGLCRGPKLLLEAGADPNADQGGVRLR